MLLDATARAEYRPGHRGGRGTIVARSAGRGDRSASARGAPKPRSDRSRVGPRVLIGGYPNTASHGLWDGRIAPESRGNARHRPAHRWRSAADPAARKMGGATGVTKTSIRKRPSLSASNETAQGRYFEEGPSREGSSPASTGDNISADMAGSSATIAPGRPQGALPILRKKTIHTVWRAATPNERASFNSMKECRAWIGRNHGQGSRSAHA